MFDRNSDTGWFVVLKDGRAGYSGDLDTLRGAVVRAVASNEVFAPALLDDAYYDRSYGFDWRW